MDYSRNELKNEKKNIIQCFLDEEKLLHFTGKWFFSFCFWWSTFFERKSHFWILVRFFVFVWAPEIRQEPSDTETGWKRARKDIIWIFINIMRFFCSKLKKRKKENFTLYIHAIHYTQSTEMFCAKFIITFYNCI